MTNSISCGFDHVWIDRMYNKQTNKYEIDLITYAF